MLHFLVLIVEEHNIGMVKKVEKMGKVKKIERMEKVRRVKEAIGEISWTHW